MGPQTTAGSDPRFSTYSSAPSLQPSIAATQSSEHRASSHNSYRYSSRYSEQASLMPHTIHEKGAHRLSYVKPSAQSDNDSSLTLASNDPRTADIKNFAEHLDRMSDARLADKQRYRLSNDKSEDMGKIALGARLDRALSRRMVGQDAVLRPKKTVARPVPIDEKRALEVEAN